MTSAAWTELWYLSDSALHLLSKYCKYGALRVLYFGQRMRVPLALHTRPTE